MTLRNTGLFIRQNKQGVLGEAYKSPGAASKQEYENGRASVLQLYDVLPVDYSTSTHVATGPGVITIDPNDKYKALRKYTYDIVEDKAVIEAKKIATRGMIATSAFDLLIAMSDFLETLDGDPVAKAKMITQIKLFRAAYVE